MNTSIVNDEKMVLGREEWVGLPGLNIPAVKARIDSGAKTSSLHAFNIQTLKKNQKQWVSFEVHPIENNRRVTVRCESEVFDKRSVKSSSGISEKRYVIKSKLLLNNKEWDIEITLSNRDSMGFRMLLGREAMNNRVIIDPSESYCLGKRKISEIESIYSESSSSKSGLKIAILASDPDLYSNKRLIEAGENRGHEMMFLNIKQCYMKLDPAKPEVHYRGGNIIDQIDAVIPRIRPSITFYGCALVRQFESMGVLCLNTANAITQSRDKLHSLQLLLSKGIDIPITGFAHSPLDTEHLIKMVGGAPLIIKLLEGTQGKGVVLAETKKASESVINAFKSLNANILAQEFIKEAEGKDLRCFVIDNKVVAAVERHAAPGEYRANIHRGGRAFLTKLSPEEKKLAILSAKTLNLSVAGVDILRSSKGPLLIECNSSPGLEGIENGSGKDIATMMIIAIEKKLGWVKK